MSLKTNNKIETNKCELEIEIDAVAFEAAVQNAYIKARKNITIPGFRKGKAPRKMIEKMYGEGTFYEDVADELIPKELQNAIEENNIEIVTKPEVEVISINKENGLLFKAVCTLKPDIEISQYLGLEIAKVVNAVTDEDVDAQIEKMREKNARLVTIEDRAAISGDETIIDFKGFIDGIAFDGGDAADFSLTLGSGQFIPGFEDQIVGHKTGEEFEINVSFPEEYQMKEIAGKPATFKINLKEIKMKEFPEVDDEFVKDTTEFETIDELKADIKAKLNENAIRQSEYDFSNNVFDTVIANVSGEIPDVMYSNRVSELLQDFAHKLETQGMNLDVYLQYTGMDIDTFKKTFEERAISEVKLRLALEKIADLEKIIVSEEEVEEEFTKLAEAHKLTVEKVKSLINLADFELDTRVGKAAELVRSSVKIS